MVALVASTALALSACSSSSDSSTPAAGSSASSSSDAFMTELATGFETAVPTTSPPAAKGKAIWWISCGQSIPDCSQPAAAAQEAATALGLDFHIADAKLNVGGGDAAAVRTAIAAGAAAIITHGFSCAQAQQALQEADDAGIKVMAVEGMDCNEAGGTGTPVFNVQMKYSATAVTNVDYFASWGTLGAKYAIGATNGTAQVINNNGNEPLMSVVNDSFVKTLGTCSGCAIVDKVTFASADYGPSGPWISQFRSALAKNPTANAVYMPYDALLTFSGGPQAVQQGGSSAITFGGSGGSAGMDQVRDGTMAAITGAHDVNWMGYAAIDNINRALQGQETVPEGVGVVVVDATHNLPATAGQGYSSSTPWKADYMKAWGLS